MRLIPSKAAPQKKPAKTDTLAYGAYMVNAAGCAECHTKFENNDFVKGTEFGGGRRFELPGGTLTTANISADIETGIGTWSEDMFVRRFKMYTDSTYVPQKVDFMKDFATIMPWMMYAKMKESDLRAIYKYLRTVKVQSNMVEKWQARTAPIASK
jgi:mono/diheme cytochrome c family protein